MATVNQLNSNNDSEWDDGPYAGYYTKDYDESNDYGNDDDEGFMDIIKSGVNAVGNILTNPLGSAVKAVSGVGKILGVTSSPASTAGIQNSPKVNGSITTAGGKTISVQMADAAHKQDVQILQAAIQKINSEIKQVADTTTNNGVALTKLTGEVNKYASAAKKQNELIATLGTGVSRMRADIKNIQSKEQTNAMLSMFMQPKLESITFKDTSGSVLDGKPHEVDSKSTDNTMLMLMMGMMGGDNSGSGGGFGDMGNNPMMMYFMMQAFNK